MAGKTSWQIGDNKEHAQARELEIKAYSALMNAFFVQGELSFRKDQILKEARVILRIGEQQHDRELNRVHSDEPLNKLQQRKGQDNYFTKGSDDPEYRPVRANSRKRKKVQAIGVPFTQSISGFALEFSSLGPKSTKRKKKVKKVDLDSSIIIGNAENRNIILDQPNEFPNFVSNDQKKEIDDEEDEDEEEDVEL